MYRSARSGRGRNQSIKSSFGSSATGGGGPGLRIALSNSTIAVGSANGTTLGTASITGGHVTGTPAWSLTDGTGTFQINSVTGVVTVLSNTDLASPGTIPITVSVSGVTPTVPTGHFNILVVSVSQQLDAQPLGMP